MFGLQRLLYGPLRQLEIEQLSEKAWYAVLDTLLAMPTLRDDVGGWTLATFVMLLALKVWSWIGEGRVEVLEQQPPRNPALFHARVATSLILSVVFDALMFHYCSRTIVRDPRPGLTVIFTFEFAILTIFSLSTLFRYALTVHETFVVLEQTKLRKAEMIAERMSAQIANNQEVTPVAANQIDDDDIEVPGWEEKRQWMLGLDLASDFIKIVIYSAFFAISINFLGFPMHVMRDVYLTVASFTKRLNDYRNYRKTTYDMNNRYPDATAQELANENTCIVCRETMEPWQGPPVTASPAAPAPTPVADAQQQTLARRSVTTEWLRAKKLPCGHILHLRCLKAWLERQQACPTCRRPVVPTEPVAPRATPAAPDTAGPVTATNAARQPARRQGVRWLNVGPVRIGYDYRAARRQAEAAQAGIQHPSYMTNTTSRSLHRSELTVQQDLRAIEQRLVRQASMMNIEQAQLTTLRSMELELERLRAQHLLVATAQSQATPSAGALHRPLPESTHFSLTSVPTASSAQILQSSPGQQALEAGHRDLPSGMTLPAGWTLLPLGRLPGAGTTVQTTMTVPVTMNQPALPAVRLFTPSPTGVGAGQTSTSLPQPQNMMQPQTMSQSARTSPASDMMPLAEQHQQQPVPPAQQVTLPGPSPVRPIVPQTRQWANSDWGFDNAEGRTSDDATHTKPYAEDGRNNSDQDQSESYTGKGKAKAVEVEDVPDAES